MGRCAQCLLVSGAAVEGFGATGEGAGVGIAGETGAAEGVNAGVVTGSSPLDAVDARECLELDVDACRAAVGLTSVVGFAAVTAAGAVAGAGVAEAPV